MRVTAARVIEVRRSGQPARARGRCVGAALESESIKCAWAGAGACARSLCAPGGVPQVLRGARSLARAERGGMGAGTFRPPRKSGSRRSEELSSAASPECPPRPHFRLPPLPRSRLPGPPVPREPRRHSPTRPALLAPTPPPPPVGSAPSEPAGRGRCRG